MNALLGSGSMLHQPPMVRLGYGEQPTLIPIHTPLVSKGLVGKMGKSLNMLNLDETLESPQRGTSMPNQVPNQHTGYHRPPMPMMGETFQNLRMQRPMQASNLHMPSGNPIPRMGESVPIFDAPGIRHDKVGPRWAQN